ncbi:MAG: hypothetical protein ACREE6_10750, partial [Limisphaerales bacterium]
MDDAITGLVIQIKADAAQAIAQLKAVATGTTAIGQGAASVTGPMAAASAAVTKIGKDAETAVGHIAGMSYFFRSSMDQVRFALMGGGARAGFFAMDELIRGLVSSGMAIGTLVPIIGGAVAAVVAGAVAWHEWNEGEEEAAKNAKDLADAWKALPGLLTQINEMQEAGLLTAKQSAHYADIAAGREKMYWDQDHQATASPTRTDRIGGGYVVGPDGIPILQPAETNIAQNTPMTRAEQGQYAMQQASGGGTITKEFLDAVKQARQEIQKSNEEALSGLAKQKAEIHDKYQTERDEMAQNLKILTANMSEAQLGSSKIVSDLNQAIAQQYVAEQKDIATLEQGAAQKQAQKQEETLDKLRKARTEELRQLDQQAQKQAEADKQHEAELQRQAQLTRDIQRSALENQIQSVKANALMTDSEKLAIVSALQIKQQQINNSEISQLQALKSQVKSVSDQLELEKKIADLKSQNQKISESNTPAQQSSFGFQFTKMLAAQSDKWTGWAQESAASFASAWGGATNSVSGGLTHLFEYGAQRGQWFQQMWNGVIGSMISSVTKLAVQWVTQHVVMTAAHAVAEQVMTGATASGASERGAIRLAETVMHNVLVLLRLAAHAAGEMAATAITAVQAMARAIYHAIAAAIGAMESEASVPYVGVILGIAAAAAVMAAAYGMMGGFSAGGYTGDGHPSQIAGLVHAGEYVIPASQAGGAMNLLRAIHSGALSDMSAPHGLADALRAP